MKRYEHARDCPPPKLDLILAVDDAKAWHKENSSTAGNKKHYTYMARFTRMRVVNYAQSKAAQVHFNACSVDHPEEGKLNIRYGVINYDDLTRDLQHWETLLGSSFM